VDAVAVQSVSGGYRERAGSGSECKGKSFQYGERCHSPNPALHNVEKRTIKKGHLGYMLL
jgi:hypothetical protein